MDCVDGIYESNIGIEYMYGMWGWYEQIGCWDGIYGQNVGMKHVDGMLACNVGMECRDKM